MARKKTYPQKIHEKLDPMEVGQSFPKKPFLKATWGDDDYFTDRTFSVSFAKAKKLMPDKLFQTIDGNITRIE